MILMPRPPLTPACGDMPRPSSLTESRVRPPFFASSTQMIRGRAWRMALATASCDAIELCGDAAVKRLVRMRVGKHAAQTRPRGASHKRSSALGSELNRHRFAGQ